MVDRNLINLNGVFDIFSQYCTYNDVKITGEEFLKNLELKKDHRDFHMDISVLLPSKATHIMTTNWVITGEGDDAKDYDRIFMRKDVP